ETVLSLENHVDAQFVPELVFPAVGTGFAEPPAHDALATLSVGMASYHAHLEGKGLQGGFRLAEEGAVHIGPARLRTIIRVGHRELGVLGRVHGLAESEAEILLSVGAIDKRERLHEVLPPAGLSPGGQVGREPAQLESIGVVPVRPPKKVVLE